MKKLTYLHGIIVIVGLGFIAGCSTGPTGTGPIIAYGVPVSKVGKLASCPGSYIGYVNYTNPMPTWGWEPSTNLIHAAANGGGCAGICISYIGEYGDANCGTTNVTIPNPPFSPAYQFTVYFRSNLPSTNYPIILTGFDETN